MYFFARLMYFFLIAMAEIERTTLFGKLNTLSYKAIEGATVFCKMRGNPYVEIVHWLHQILQLPESDIHCIVKQFNINPAVLAKDLRESSLFPPRLLKPCLLRQ